MIAAVMNFEAPYKEVRTSTGAMYYVQDGKMYTLSGVPREAPPPPPLPVIEQKVLDLDAQVRALHAQVEALSAEVKTNREQLAQQIALVAEMVQG